MIKKNIFLNLQIVKWRKANRKTFQQPLLLSLFLLPEQNHQHSSLVAHWLSVPRDHGLDPKVG